MLPKYPTGVVCLFLFGMGTTLGPLLAHEDVLDGPRGVERVADQIQGQGRNTSIDRAYALWAQTEANQTLILDRPRGKRWISVSEGILFAKRTWGVNILDETQDGEVGKIEFAMGFGEVDKEFALPLFLQALTSAVERRQDCYVEQDDKGFFAFGFKAHTKGTVHIRRARPLQADYDHPTNPDEEAIRKLEAAVAAENAPKAEAVKPKDAPKKGEQKDTKSQDQPKKAPEKK